MFALFLYISFFKFLIILENFQLDTDCFNFDDKYLLHVLGSRHSWNRSLSICTFLLNLCLVRLHLPEFIFNQRQKSLRISTLRDLLTEKKEN